MFRWVVLLPLLALCIVVALPVLTVVGYGCERNAMIEELSRLGALRNCPGCGYDLRVNSGRCPECGITHGRTGSADARVSE